MREAQPTCGLYNPACTPPAPRLHPVPSPPPLLVADICGEVEDEDEDEDSPVAFDNDRLLRQEENRNRVTHLFDPNMETIVLLL